MTDNRKFAILLLIPTVIALGAVFLTGSIDVVIFRTELAVLLTGGILSLLYAIFQPEITHFMDKLRSRPSIEVEREDFRRAKPPSLWEWFFLGVVFFYAGLIFFAGASTTYLVILTYMAFTFAFIEVLGLAVSILIIPAFLFWRSILHLKELIARKRGW